MQVMFATLQGKFRHLRLPPPEEDVLPGIPWGRFDELFTPAFWRGQAWQHETLGTYTCLRLGRTLKEETAACLLGGYGMRAELGLAAYRRVRDSGFCEVSPSVQSVEEALSKPFE